MAKRALKLHFRLPPYVHPRIEWRKLIHEAATAAMRKRDVSYTPDDQLAVNIVVYFEVARLRWHDVDNRLKDVLDALQGRLGGPKSVRAYAALIPNDNQIHQVSVTKAVAPPQSHGLGHVTVTRYRPPA
jgi:Holliday junction resolvase RusA-like endonuclease